MRKGPQGGMRKSSWWASGCSWSVPFLASWPLPRSLRSISNASRRCFRSSGSGGAQEHRAIPTGELPERLAALLAVHPVEARVRRALVMVALMAAPAGRQGFVVARLEADAALAVVRGLGGRRRAAERAREAP